MFTAPTYSNIVAGPSGEYGFGTPDRRLNYESNPVVQVLQLVKGKWYPTPARYAASTIVSLAEGSRLSIDYGQGWALDATDTNAFRAYAQEALGLVPA